MRIRLLCLAFLIAGALTSCSSSQDTGNKRLTPGSIATIRKGTTTREQLRAVLGPPQSAKTQVPIAQPPGTRPLPAKYAASEIWAFWTRHREGPSLRLPFLTSAAARQSSYTVIIFFDERGIVLDYETEEAHS